jgi:polyvinyl alcohol dehydrogenase (cytochrome)
VADCLTAEPDDWKTRCYPPDARFNSIIALDLNPTESQKTQTV